MKSTAEITQLNDQEGKGLGIIEKEEEKNGRYIQLWVTPKESSKILGLKMKWAKMGIKLPFSQILKALAKTGLDNIDWVKLDENPTTLFSGVPTHES